MTDAIHIDVPGSIADAMAVMDRAFDPEFGEAWTLAQCSGVLAMPGAELFVARQDGVVGFALVRTILEEAELMLLAVLPESRNRGVGRALLTATMSAAAASGAKAYFLEVRSDNPAISLYEHCGLVNVGRRKDYYRGSNGIRRDALTFRGQLDKI